MGKIILIAQGAQIRDFGEELRKNLNLGDTFETVILHMDEAVEYARGLDRDEVDILIARGDSAKMLKQAKIPFPVVDIELTEENIVESIVYAEKISEKEYPKIGFVGMEMMAAKVRFFFSLLKPTIKIYTAKSSANIRAMVNKAKADGMDVIMGGVRTCSYASEIGMKVSPVESSYELVQQAYERARALQQSIDLERGKREEINTILNSVEDAIISMNAQGIIERINQRAERIFKGPELKYRGHSLNMIFGRAESEIFWKALKTGEKIQGAAIRVGERDYAVNLLPIKVKSELKGMVATLTSVSELQKTEAQIRRKMLQKGNVAEYTFSDIRGKSKQIQESIRLAKTFAPLESNVLLIGQTGTGKELFAQSIHNASARKEEPFVAVNCGALPDNLLESELFGYIDGAFTGAKKGGKMGLIELAHNGTLFLDEISEMSLSGQVRLLRVIQEQQVRRVGSDTVIPVNVRIIAACNQNLKRQVEEKKFRKDLYYRLSVLVLKIPPLCDRSGDIAFLAEHFISEFNEKFARKVFLTENAKSEIEKLSWDGNIRQLRNFCERVVAIAETDALDAEWILENYRNSYEFDEMDRDEQKQDSGVVVQDDSECQNAIGADRIREVLERYKGNKTKTAQALGISRTTLWKYLKELS